MCRTINEAGYVRVSLLIKIWIMNSRVNYIDIIGQVNTPPINSDRIILFSAINITPSHEKGSSLGNDMMD